MSAQWHRNIGRIPHAALTAAILIALLGAGCSKAADYPLSRSREQVAEPAKSAPAETAMDADEGAGSFENAKMRDDNGAKAPVLAPQIIKTATVSLQVSDIKEASQKLEALTKRFKGQVTNQTLTLASEDNAHRSGELTVQVPQADLETFLAAAGKEGTVLSQNMTGEDVSAQVVDLRARLRNSRAEESALIGILHQSAKVPDVLAVSKELARVRGDIESAQGQLNQFREKISYSTVTLSFAEESIHSTDHAQPSLGNAIANAGRDAMNALYGFALLLSQLLIWLLVFAAPILLAVFAVMWLLWQGIKHLFRRRPKAVVSSQPSTTTVDMDEERRR